MRRGASRSRPIESSLLVQDVPFLIRSSGPMHRGRGAWRPTLGQPLTRSTIPVDPAHVADSSSSRDPTDATRQKLGKRCHGERRAMSTSAADAPRARSSNASSCSNAVATDGQPLHVDQSSSPRCRDLLHRQFENRGGTVPAASTMVKNRGGRFVDGRRAQQQQQGPLADSAVRIPVTSPPGPNRDDVRWHDVATLRPVPNTRTPVALADIKGP